jgi:hypothetical protein
MTDQQKEMEIFVAQDLPAGSTLGPWECTLYLDAPLVVNCIRLLTVISANSANSQ